LKEELRQEKQFGVSLKEQLRSGEEERLRNRDAVHVAELRLEELKEERAELRHA